jgi:hypothetical protein
MAKISAVLSEGLEIDHAAPAVVVADIKPPPPAVSDHPPAKQVPAAGQLIAL